MPKGKAVTRLDAATATGALSAHHEHTLIVTQGKPILATA